MTIYIPIGIVLIAWAHFIRDGTPSLGSTTLARLVAGMICMVASVLIFAPVGWVGLGLGAAIYLGFYTDSRHAAGQRARGWGDAGLLAVSGVTSIVPLVVTGAFLSVIGPGCSYWWDFSSR